MVSNSRSILRYSLQLITQMIACRAADGSGSVGLASWIPVCPVMANGSQATGGAPHAGDVRTSVMRAFGG